MSDQSSWKALIEDRERGILTVADREFLLDKKDLSDQSARDARYRIRKRTKNGLRDIALLDRFLENRDRIPVAKELLKEDEYSKANMSRLLSFPFRMLVDVEGQVEVAKSRLEDVLKTSLSTVTRELLEDDYIINVDIDITIDYYQPEIEELVEKYEKDEESFKELQFLREKNAIDADTVYHRHVLRHAWERGQGFAVPNQEGEMRVFEASNYESRENFIEDGLKALREANFIEADSE